MMTPALFIDRWRANSRGEAAAAKAHFLDLCDLLGVPKPQDDPTGANYAFEKEVAKTSGRRGFADVWKRKCFGWEYKSPGSDLEKAHEQLLRYAGALENPPLLISSDLERIVVRTNWTNLISEKREIALDDLRSAAVRDQLRACWLEPDRWKPEKTRQALTEQAAAEFAGLAQRLRARGHGATEVAHFVNRLVFCLFAEDVGLLPLGLVDGMLSLGARNPASFAPAASELFQAMRNPGGRVGFQLVQWFNGGLFDDDRALPLDAADIAMLERAAALRWDEIDPSIFGTLFERGLDPDKRSQLGAHYTDREKIEILVDAVVLQPLSHEWTAVKSQISAAMTERAALVRAGTAVATDNEHARVLAGAERITAEARAAKGALRKAADRRTKRMNTLLTQAATAYRTFLARLRSFRVLDPACGSGNFLYLSLLRLKDLELRIAVEAEALGLDPAFPSIGPEAVLGIEINPYAAELARVSVWIGHIQWAKRNGYPPPADPVLRTLDTIECRDAVLTGDGAPAEWLPANAIVGNPPFLGDKAMRSTLGDVYTERLRTAYAGRVSGGADLVCFWFEKARQAIEAGRAERVGLVATQSIRKGESRRVLDRILDHSAIYDAWSDEPWTLDGADVRVSLVCFAPQHSGPMRLNGRIVPAIFADLSGGTVDITTAARLTENRGTCFQGPVKVGPFDVPGDLARKWLMEPANANGRPNADVVRPWVNGMDLTRRSSDTWIVDFADRGESEAAFFSRPFAHAMSCVKPLRDQNKRARRRELWWQHGETVPGLRLALADVQRFIATPRVAKHRVFVWCPSSVLPDSRVYAFAREDDTAFGILHSHIHEVWSLAHASRHGIGNDPTYNNITCFETFPFPDGLEPNIPAAAYAEDPRAQSIAAATRSLVEARDRWLNPPELVNRVPEVVTGFPDRLIPKNGTAAALLKKRTLTVLYNTRGTPEGAWLDRLHADLDAAVAAAYGWPADITNEEMLVRLLALNHERAAREASSEA